MKDKIIENGISYTIMDDGKNTCIICKLCKIKSYNNKDISNKYCEKCHIWHYDIERIICDAD